MNALACQADLPDDVRGPHALLERSLDGLTPHKLRHTYTSVLAALGTDHGAMMELLAHTDPGFTLRVYRHGMRRDQESKDRLRALVGVDGPGTNGVSGTNSGTNGQTEGASSVVEREQQLA